MAEQLADFFVTQFNGKLPSGLISFIVSMMPILELRGGLIAAKLMDVELIKAFILCYLGNMLPIPFILLFIRKIFEFLKKSPKISPKIEKLEIRSLKKGEKIEKYSVWALLLFVGIPLPGTGGWTGALIAALLHLPIKKSLPVIALGVLIAGFIVASLSYGLLGVFGF